MVLQTFLCIWGIWECRVQMEGRKQLSCYLLSQDMCPVDGDSSIKQDIGLSEEQGGKGLTITRPSQGLTQILKRPYVLFSWCTVVLC